MPRPDVVDDRPGTVDKSPSTVDDRSGWCGRHVETAEVRTCSFHDMLRSGGWSHHNILWFRG